MFFRRLDGRSRSSEVDADTLGVSGDRGGVQLDAGAADQGHEEHCRYLL